MDEAAAETRGTGRAAGGTRGDRRASAIAVRSSTISGARSCASSSRHPASRTFGAAAPLLATVMPDAKHPGRQLAARRPVRARHARPRLLPRRRRAASPRSVASTSNTLRDLLALSGRPDAAAAAKQRAWRSKSAWRARSGPTSSCATPTRPTTRWILRLLRNLLPALTGRAGSRPQASRAADTDRRPAELLQGNGRGGERGSARGLEGLPANARRRRLRPADGRQVRSGRLRLP